MGDLKNDERSNASDWAGFTFGGGGGGGGGGGAWRPRNESVRGFADASAFV